MSCVCFDVSLENASFELLLCRYFVPEGCVSFASIDLVCNELSVGIRYVGVYEFVNEFMYVSKVTVS